MILSLLLALSARADDSLRVPVQRLDDGAVLIKLGGEVVDADAALAPPRNPFPDARPITLQLQDADIHSVLRLISDVAGVNIVASDDVKGTVTVYLTDVPWDQALAVILASKGLGATAYGERILMVAPQPQAPK